MTRGRTTRGARMAQDLDGSGEARDWLVQSLEPLPAGRPAIARHADDPRIATLEAQVSELTLQIEAAGIREEIALTMPHLLVREARRSSQRSLSSRLQPLPGSGGKRGVAKS